MSKPLHHPTDPKTYHKGANADTEKEFLGRQGAGMYVDAQNMRPEPIDGENGALSKIKGEVMAINPQVLGSDTYRCLGNFVVSGHVVAYWASEQANLYPPLMTIDGIVKVYSALLPWVYNKPFQFARAEDCDEGLIMGVDDHSIPMLFSIKEINDAYDAGELTYFDEFDPAIYYINPTAPVERPQFIGLVDNGAGGGLPPGQYAYSLRFVDADGNATNWGPDTPLIAIPTNLGAVTGYTPEPGMPGASLQGGTPADPPLPSRYAAHLRWRINNTGNYARIELRRKEINVGNGIDTVPVSVLVHAINIAPGINPYVNFIDTGASLEVLAEDETNAQALYVLKAKGVRYIDNRFALANIEVAPKDVEITFREVGGQKMFAITKSIGKAGHNDPVNHAYHKTEIRGERRRYGIQLYDGIGGKAFVVPLPDEFQFPSRRDEKSGDSLLFSDAPCWAANVDHVVTPTFEAFDMEDAVTKGRVADFVNVMVNGQRNLSDVDNPSPYPDAASTNTYIDTNFNTVKTIDCRPLRPVRPTDSQFGHNYRMNLFVRDQASTSTPATSYNPRLFEPTFHTLGAALYGLLDLFPWVTGFSIVQSEPAGRVVCQGLASYKLDSVEGQPSVGGKSNFTLSVHFPDMESGLVDQNTINDFIANPQNYTLQAQSPLGFGTEVLGGVSIQQLDQTVNGNSALTDMISYARVLWDEGQVNPIYTQAGIQPTLGGTPHSNYVGFDAWRNTIPANSQFHGGGNNGNSLVSFSPTTVVSTQAGSSHFEVSCNSQFYFGGTPSSRQFSAADTKNFHEPLYVVNLTRDGAHVDPDLIDTWIPTGQYQRMRSIIGVGNGQPGQEFILIDERKEDVYSQVLGELRYVYVNGLPWVLADNLGVNINLVINAINQDGFWVDPDGVSVYGIYNFIAGDIIRIGSFGINPQVGDIIEIRYNSNVPVKFFGGDATICGAMAMPINMVSKIGVATVGPSNANADVDTPLSINSFTPNSPQFINGCPLPFPVYVYNPRYYVPYGVVDNNPNDDGGNGSSAVNQTLEAKPYSIRQWGIYYDCESRTPLHLSTFTFDSQNVGYPHIHYVLRPFTSFQSDTLANNGVFDGYATEYGNEISLWEYGGIKWRKPTNYDYAFQPPPSSFSKPAFGYEEKTDLCNVIIWTPRVTDQLQNSPGYRTFPATNIRWIQSDAGQINKLYSAISGNGFNLYALTSSGVCQILIGKNILTGADGNTLSYTRQDEFITDGGEIWLSKTIGLPGETWQLAAEGRMGNPMRDTLFFADRNSAYALTGGAILDIAKGRYRTRVRPFMQTALEWPDTIMSSMYDPQREEWMLGTIPQPLGAVLETPSASTLMYSASELVSNWIGSNSYRFDKMIAHADRVIGHRDLQTWYMDTGDLIDGQPVHGWVQQACSPVGLIRKEFDRVSVTSITKPTYVEFYDEDGTLVCILDAALATSLGYPAASYLKMKDGWQGFIPRETVSRLRLQGRVMQFRVGHNTQEPFRLIETGIQYKLIK